MTLKAFFSVISGTFMLAGQALAQPYTFIPIDVHCPAAAAASACPAGLAPGQVAAQTSARGINSRGDIVGSYVAGGRQRGFLLADGQFTTLEFPVPVVRATIANGINARREIVGQYTAPVHDSSDNGDIYGCLHDHDLGPSMHGAARTRAARWHHGRSNVDEQRRDARRRPHDRRIFRGHV